MSGGSDSTALLVAAKEFADRYRVKMQAATVDHGLRQEAASEAAQVARLCETLGVTHCVLTLEGLDASANLQERARLGRYDALRRWAQTERLSMVLIGHTRDDVAETFLQRLARGAGVDGLAEMDWHWKTGPLDWFRPFLELSRDDLQDFLRDKGIDWSEDPSNDDIRFERVRVRKALAVLGDLGINAERISESAVHLRMARTALERQARDAADVVEQDALGDLLLSWQNFVTLPFEARRRVAVGLVRWVGRRPHPPRRDEQHELLRKLWDKQTCTVSGCVVTCGADKMLRFARERGDIGTASGPTTEIWDGRWRLDGPHSDGLRIAALGDEGLKSCKGWRETGLERRSLEASPAVWRGDVLVAAPMAGLANGWCATLTRSKEQFLSSLLTH